MYVAMATRVKCSKTAFYYQNLIVYKYDSEIVYISINFKHKLLSFIVSTTF